MNSQRIVTRRINAILKTVKVRDINQSDNVGDDYHTKYDSVIYNLTPTENIIEMNIDNSEDVIHQLWNTRSIISSSSVTSFLMVLRYNIR